MTRVLTFVVSTALVAAPAWAQTAPERSAPSELGHQIYLMEGALARAVNSGAARLNQEIRAIMPDMMVLAGESNARGFHLERYGVFFDVEVPVLRQSMMWSLRTIIDHDDQQAANAVQALRTFISRSSGQERAAAEASLQLLEAELRPFQMARRAQGVGLQSGAPGEPAPQATPAPFGKPVNSLLLTDPNKAYTDSVVRALIDAMIDFSPVMTTFLAADEFLTVAARDNERRDMFAPPNPYEQVSTFMLRVKGSDLAAYRAGKIDRDEARKRVEVKEH